MNLLLGKQVTHAFSNHVALATQQYDRMDGQISQNHPADLGFTDLFRRARLGTLGPLPPQLADEFARGVYEFFLRPSLILARYTFSKVWLPAAAGGGIVQQDQDDPVTTVAQRTQAIAEKALRIATFAEQLGERTFAEALTLLDYMNKADSAGGAGMLGVNNRVAHVAAFASNVGDQLIAIKEQKAAIILNMACSNRAKGAAIDDAIIGIQMAGETIRDLIGVFSGFTGGVESVLTPDIGNGGAAWAAGVRGSLFLAARQYGAAAADVGVGGLTRPHANLNGAAYNGYALPNQINNADIVGGQGIVLMNGALPITFAHKNFIMQQNNAIADEHRFGMIPQNVMLPPETIVFTADVAGGMALAASGYFLTFGVDPAQQANIVNPANAINLTGLDNANMQANTTVQNLFGGAHPQLAMAGTAPANAGISGGGLWGQWNWLLEGGQADQADPVIDSVKTIEYSGEAAVNTTTNPNQFNHYVINAANVDNVWGEYNGGNGATANHAVNLVAPAPPLVQQQALWNPTPAGAAQSVHSAERYGIFHAAMVKINNVLTNEAQYINRLAAQLSGQNANLMTWSAAIHAELDNVAMALAGAYDLSMTFAEILDNAGGQMMWAMGSAIFGLNNDTQELISNCLGNVNLMGQVAIGGGGTVASFGLDGAGGENSNLVGPNLLSGIYQGRYGAATGINQLTADL